jgi:MFS family permease
MTEDREPLFSFRYLLMCGFTFTVFLSAFQLLPTAPFRILDLGGSSLGAGLFLGCLTYTSAFSAPFTGALADRVGPRRILLVCGAMLVLFSIAYGLTRHYEVMLLLALVHGVFWSGLLSASAAYVTSIIPERRRAEGIGYWGMATILAVAIAPTLGLFFFRFGWPVLCAVTAALHLAMVAIAWNLPRQETATKEPLHPLSLHTLIEWRVLGLSFTLFLYSFGYGGITSFVALYAKANAVGWPAVFFSVFALVTLLARLFLGRLADEIGHRKVFLPCLVLIVIGLALLARGGTLPWLISSAIVFGAGFGAAYPIFAAYILDHVPTHRRGAAFGAILAAFDTGIGTGSITAGFIIGRWSYRPAYAVAACLAALSLPFFLIAERRLFGFNNSSMAYNPSDASIRTSPS